MLGKLISKIIYVRVLEFAHIKIKGIMKAAGTMINVKEKGMNDLVMEIFMKETTKQEKFVAKEYIDGPTVICMMEIGLTGKSMDMVFGRIPKVTAI